MKRGNRTAVLSRILLTVTVLVLTAMVLWFISLPEKDYEPAQGQPEDVAITERISEDGILQTLKSKGILRGIVLRFYTARTVPEDGVIVDLADADTETFLERVIVDPSEIRDNTETEIVFTGSYQPGNYMVMLSALPDSEDRIWVWESGNDNYKDGEAYNSSYEPDGRDWYFHLLTAFPESMMIRHKIERILYAILTVLACAGALAWIYGSERLMKRKAVQTAAGFARKNSDRILIFLLLLIPTLVYLDFLTGERLYVFSMLDRGSDSVGQTYPVLLNTAARIRNGLLGELFNFEQGLGDAEAALFPTLTNWVSLFGESAVARLMGVSQWAKVVLSGLFAFLFAREYGAGKASRFAVALGYAFNCMLIARGAWVSYPNIALLAIFWLYAYERRLKGKNPLLMIFATLIMFINLGLYDCVFYGILLPGYMLVRRSVKEETFREGFRAFLKDLGWFAVFALAGMMDTVRFTIAKALGSSRLQEGLDTYGESLGGFFSDAEIWMSAFLRTIGLSINGVTWHTGSLNLLEGPTFYTGITAILAAPAALWCMKGKQKGIYLALVLCAACYIAIAPLRFVANGFAKETFKLSSFWITILLLVFSVDFFRRMERKELRKGTLAVLGITALVLIGLLITARACGYVASVNAWWISLAFVALYLILAGLYLSGTRPALIRALVILCVIAEAVLVPYEVIHDRNMETAAENSMNDHMATKEIIDSLPGDEWYRVEKDYVNVFQSDSLAEGYRGSSSYLGGIEINQSVLDIYQAYSLPQRTNHYLYGNGANIYFDSVAAIRYMLARNEMEFRYGYELKDEKNGIRIYENRYAHPFVYVSEDLTSPDGWQGDYSSGSLVAYESIGNMIRFGKLPDNCVLIMEAEFDHSNYSVLYMQDRDNRLAAVNFMGTEHTVIEIANSGVQSLWFDFGARNHMQETHFYAVDRETYYQAYRERCAEAQRNAVRMETVHENRFTGNVKTREGGYLITAIPYDKKWEVMMNGEKQETMTVNGGFLGARIPEGEYQIDIRYSGDSWLKGNMFKIMGIGGFLFTVAVVQLINKRKERMS